ncbi:MAG: DUF2062 domain-containing protein [Gammaproteobacteria bacterium]|nr:DUF2062 domain-containing protein [Gammaproteobacteria bacterium]
MPKKLIKRYLPDHHKICNHPHLNRIFGTLLHDPNLLHLNRRSVSYAIGIGLFLAFIPIPFQMVPAAACAIIFRFNLPIAVAMVWISNPVTIPPIFYFCYTVGTWMLQTPTLDIEFQASPEWLATELAAIWEPFLLGCFTVSTVSGLLGFITIRLLWRLHIVKHIKERRLRLHNRKVM